MRSFYSSNSYRSNTAVTSRYGVAGLKAAMDLLGYFGGDPRAPLLPVVEKEREILKNVLIGAGLL
jgi:4-hydroxy-2-oxoglutarate aldolase